jgi:hypothetical protein
VSHEASLEVEQKNLEDACLKVVSHELAAEVHEANLRTQADAGAGHLTKEVGGSSSVLGQ